MDPNRTQIAFATAGRFLGLALVAGLALPGQAGEPVPPCASHLPNAYLLDPTLAPPVTTLYPRDPNFFINPERGFVDSIDFLNTSDYSGYRSAGVSLLWSYVRLDAYRNAPLDATFLSNLDAALGRVRAGGVKVFLRFTYNFSGTDPDAPESVILNHISQLAPILTKNVDVLAFLQAGFIGAWGEWHNSTNGLDNTAAHQAVLFALLHSLPKSLMLQLRYPVDKAAIFNSSAPLTAANAFTQSDQARVGFHNDCFLADSSDGGTYPSGSTDWKAYLAQDGRFGPVGGETCALDSPRSDCPTATSELRMLHFSWLNKDYNQDVLNTWKSQGCYDPINLGLGYRFVLTSASYSQVVRAGQTIQVTLNLNNEGFASMYNARPVVLVLDNASSRFELPLPVAAADPRRWESGTTQVNASLVLPASVPAGCYRLSLWLPDPAPGLAKNPQYAVRLANLGTWDGNTGLNVLAARFPVLAP